MLKTLFLTCNQDLLCWNLPVDSFTTNAYLWEGLGSIFSALPAGSCGLQWDITPHPEPSFHQAGQAQVPQPHLHHVLQPLHHLDVVGWAPACLSLVCGCPGLRYAAFASTDYRGAIAALDLQTQPIKPPVLFCFSSPAGGTQPVLFNRVVSLSGTNICALAFQAMPGSFLWWNRHR